MLRTPPPSVTTLFYRECLPTRKAFAVRGMPCLAGQFRHLRGRIAALVELTMPIDRDEGEG